MMSMVGVELTDLISTWKTVSKGSRSTSRRPRRLDSKSLKMGVEQADGRSRAEEASASESEKLGVAVLGRRFADRAEHVPIKKRRFLFRSPSPPPRAPSPCHEDSEPDAISGRVYGQWPDHSLVSGCRVVSADASTAAKFSCVVNEGVVKGNSSEVMKENPSYGQDFSGIEMLVAAACNDSMVDDGDVAETDMKREDLVHERFDASSSTVPSHETVAGDSLCTDELNGSEHILPSFPPTKEDREEDKLVSPHVDRSLWDLNTDMDAWEQPSSDLVAKNAGSEDTVVHKNQEYFEDCKTFKESEADPETTTQSIILKAASPDARGGGVAFHNAVNLALGSSITNKDENEFGSSYDKISVQRKIIPKVEPAVELSSFPVCSEQTSTPALGMDVCVEFSSCAGSNCMTASVMSEELKNATSSTVVIKQEKEECFPGMHVGRIEEVENHNIDVMHALGSEKTTCESVMKEEIEDIGSTSHLHDNNSLPRLSKDKCQSPPAIDELDRRNGKVMTMMLQLSPKCEDALASAASVAYVEGQPRVSDDAVGQENKALGPDKAETDSPMSCGQKELVNRSSSYPAPEVDGCGSSSHEQKSPGNDHSDDFQDDCDHMVGMENMSELQEGYDSQYEDGELRESLVPCLNDIDPEDGEAEQVDYESDDRDMYDMDDADRTVSFESSMRETSCQPLDSEQNKRHSVKPLKLPSRKGVRKDEKPESDVEVTRGLSGGSKDVNRENEQSSGGHALKDPSHSETLKSGWSAWDRQSNGCVASPNMTKEVSNGNMRRNLTNGCLGASDMKDISTRVVGLRESRKALLSHNEGSSSLNLLRRNRNARLHQKRMNERDDMDGEDERGPCVSDRGTARMKSSLHMHGRGRAGSQLDDHRMGLWNSKQHHFRSYDGPYDSRKPRPRSIVINSDSKVDDGGLSMYSPPRGVYRPFVRRRSPARREDDYPLHRGIPARDISPEGTRGRSGRYPQRLSPKEGYFRPLPNDSSESYVRMPPNLSRRERSFSPMFSRGDGRFSRPHERYRSRSRSQSPILRQMPRDRNLRPLSRSPDFRSEARMERVRMPIRKPGFESDYEVDFMSPPRRRFSPKRNPRWTDDRNRSVDEFRNRRSPPRLLQQNHRFGSPGSPGRSKPDEYFRPAMRSGRFSNNMGCAGRGRKDSDDDDYRRKPGNRYQMFHPVRRYGTDGGVRRFQYDADGFAGQCSDDRDDCIDGVDKRHRDMPRGSRERSFNMWP